VSSNSRQKGAAVNGGALSNSYDLWFTAWPARSKTTGLGATPADAFKIETGVDLLDVMRLGSRIIKRSTDGHRGSVHPR